MALDRSEKELLLREFRLNGFVILRNLLPPDLVTRMYENLAPVPATEYRASQSGKSNIPLVDFGRCWTRPTRSSEKKRMQLHRKQIAVHHE